MKYLAVAALSCAAGTSLGASRAPDRPFNFFNILPDKIATYPKCDAPEAAELICQAGDLDAGSMKFIFIELRPFAPKYLTSNIRIVPFPDGRPKTFYVQTGGAAVQQEVLDYLRLMYGKPSSIEHIAKQNAFGAQIPAIIAVWDQRKDFLITFTGVTNKIDEGEISAVDVR